MKLKELTRFSKSVTLINLQLPIVAVIDNTGFSPFTFSSYLPIVFFSQNFQIKSKIENVGFVFPSTSMFEKNFVSINIFGDQKTSIRIFRPKSSWISDWKLVKIFSYFFFSSFFENTPSSQKSKPNGYKPFSRVFGENHSTSLFLLPFFFRYKTPLNSLINFNFSKESKIVFSNTLGICEKFELLNREL